MTATGRRIVIFGILLFLPYLPQKGLAKEAVYLKTGFRLEAESHSQNGDVYTFRMAGGTVEFNVSQIDSIEVSPDSVTPPPPVNPLPTVSASTTSPEQILVKASADQGLPPEFVLSVAKVESAMHQEAISPKGARGLMQLMPATAVSLGVEANRPEENAKGGAMYLRALLLRYHNDAVLALAAYNAGPGAVDKYGGVPPYPETWRYIQRVLAEYERQEKKHTEASASKPNATN